MASVWGKSWGLSWGSSWGGLTFPSLPVYREILRLYSRPLTALQLRSTLR